MGFNPKPIAAMLENIVYFELRHKGYKVYIGKNETKDLEEKPVSGGIPNHPAHQIPSEKIPQTNSRSNFPFIAVVYLLFLILGKAMYPPCPLIG